MFLFFSCQKPQFQEPYKSTRIVRDAWGVPHIMAPKDEEVAYGLAWAQCEDDFNTIQEQMLAIKGKLGCVRGEKGIRSRLRHKIYGLG